MNYFSDSKKDFLILNGTEHLWLWLTYHFATAAKLIQRRKKLKLTIEAGQTKASQKFLEEKPSGKQQWTFV